LSVALTACLLLDRHFGSTTAADESISVTCV